VLIDIDRPWAKTPGRGGVTLRNLRDPQAGVAGASSSPARADTHHDGAPGADMRVDIALQGPKSRDILLALGADVKTAERLKALKRTELCDAVVGGFDLIVARTGYTGEQLGFELFVHPQQSVALWSALMKAGTPMGMKPCGLAARDSLRTEAGLPLYGDELAGHLNLGVGDAGFESYVKPHKPWFIGRKAFIEQEQQRRAEVARFRFNAKSGRMAHNGDPVLDAEGRVVGQVTCCSIDTEGYRLGQAWVEFRCMAEGTPVQVLQGAGEALAHVSPRPATLAEIQSALASSGEKVKARAPEAATVLSRFPKRK
jgi:glycine hydroxymethyltransferase